MWLLSFHISDVAAIYVFDTTVGISPIRLLMADVGRKAHPSSLPLNIEGSSTTKTGKFLFVTLLFSRIYSTRAANRSLYVS